MISVVTVNFKTIEYTLRMLDSLFAYHDSNNIEVFVVENASGDSLDLLKARFPQIKIIESHTNIGFAGGCNLAIKQSIGDIVVLINPDIIFEDNALEQIYEKMQNDSKIGIAGVSLKNLDGTQQDCVWSFPRPLDQLLVLLKIHHIFPGLKPIKKWLMKGFDYSRSGSVDQVMGAFFAIRREVIDQIGLLDDKFFMWYEEVDFCKRAKDAGWKIQYFADIHALHKKGASFDKVMTIKKQAILRKSIRRYMKKHYGLAMGILFKCLEPIFWITGLIASLIKPC